MRRALAASLFSLSALAAGGAWAQQGTPAPAPARPLQTLDVPMTEKPQTVYILRRVFTPAEHAGMHTHDGAEIAQIVAGEVRVDLRGGTSTVYHVGESFMVPRGVVHDATNVGPGEAALAITYVLDKGAPLRVAVP